MRKLSSEKSDSKTKKIDERVIVSKNTFFINEQGKLVHQDLVIKGDKYYGKPAKDFDESIVYNRLKRSREKRKSRSRERSM